MAHDFCLASCNTSYVYFCDGFERTKNGSIVKLSRPIHQFEITGPSKMIFESEDGTDKTFIIHDAEDDYAVRVIMDKSLTSGTVYYFMNGLRDAFTVEVIQ